jgi:hypothetical protein
MLLHQALHWPEQTQLDLWPFALEHADYLWNHLPRKDSMIAPVELFTGATFDNFHHIQRARVWGVQFTFWIRNCKTGKRYLSGIHVPDVACLSACQMLTRALWGGLNVRTGNVSPQYHVVYDDLFTVPNADSGGVEEEMQFNPNSWLQVLETGWERLAGPIDEASSGSRFVPSLDREWLSDDELPPSASDTSGIVQCGGSSRNWVSN